MGRVERHLRYFERFDARARILARVELVSETGCWIWMGSVSPAGYGEAGSRFSVRSADRLSYEAFVGPIPDGLELDHLCRVRCCVAPYHLEPVTHAVNVDRGRIARWLPGSGTPGDAGGCVSFGGSRLVLAER